MPFYKYQPINKYTLQNLIKKKNWISDPIVFNDPFEFRIKETSSLDENGELKYLNKNERAIREMVLNNIKSYGVVCYSANEHNKLLWSHYADNHYGMCLVFDVPKPLDVGLRKVNYLVSYPEVNFDVNTDFLGTEIAKIVTTKGIDWSYEEEYRQIFLKKNCHESYPGKLIEVIFGCRTLIDDIEMIVEVLNGFEEEITISKMMIQPNTYFLGKSTIPSNNKPILVPEWFKNISY